MGRQVQRDVEKLIRGVHAAALEPVLWPDWLRAYSDALGGVACAVIPSTGFWSGQDVAFTEKYDPDFSATYRAHYHTQDPFRDLWHEYPVGRLFYNQEVIAPELVEPTPFYQEWMRPQGFRVSASLGAMLERCPGHPPAVFAAHSLRGRREIDTGAFQLTEFLLPHVVAAVGIGRELGMLAARRAAWAEVLEELDIAVLAVDARGRIQHANGAARSLIAEEDALACRRTGIEGASLSVTATLQRLIAAAATLGGGPGGVLRLPRRSGGSDLLARVAPLRLPGVEPPSTLAAVVIRDPRARRSPVAAFAARFSLTPAEAALAGRLAAGEGLAEIADSTRRSIHTLRGTLKRIQSKTGARRQADLVAKLSALTALTEAR